MMLDDRSSATIKLEVHRDDAVNQHPTNGVNFASNSHANFGPSSSNTLDGRVHSSHLVTTNLLNNHNPQPLLTGNKASNLLQHHHHQPQQHQVQDNFRDHHQPHHHQQQQHHHHHQQQQQPQHQNQQIRHNLNEEQYPTSDETNSSGYNLTPSTSTTGSGSLYHDNKSGILSHSHNSPSVAEVNVESTRHSAMVPTTAHCSDQQANMHYSLSNAAKNLPTTSPSNMALNFSHDLLQGQSSLHHHSNDDGDHKPNHLSNSGLDLESGTHLMQTAANLNMWKSNMGLNFKPSAINEHSFLPSSDMNSFSNWSHAANTLSHQPAPNMSHHILDGQLIGYPHQHNQRSLQLPNQQDLVGATLKNQVCAEQASLMISFNQASQQAQMNNHHGSHQSNDNLHLRSQSHDHNATSYNLSMNDNQFYNNRSHGSTIKSSVFLQDRSGPSHSNHQNNHTSYHNAEHLHPQPTTSHHVAGSSSGGSSRNIGTFKCPHCSEIFSMRNLYQSHVKSHSQEKGSKAKFHCELCGHSFSQKTSLNRHMKSHTGERPFPCEVCGKAFSEKERLKIHMRTHTGEKPFSCGICGKSFSQKSTVKRHQTVHTGEKKFKCDCGKGFANRGNLIAHIKTRGSNHFE